MIAVRSAEDHAHQRVVPVRALADHAGDQDHADEHHRDRRQRAVLGPLAERKPGKQPNEHDLDVAEHGGEPGAHRLDRVVPEGEVGGEHQARDPERHPLAQRPPAVAAAPRARRAPPARAARTRSGRTPPWRATPRPAARGSPRTRSRGRRARRRVQACQSRRTRLPRGMVPPVDRDSVLWTIVVFFGASILFAAIRNATQDESTGVLAGGCSSWLGWCSWRRSSSS